MKKILLLAVCLITSKLIIAQYIIQPILQPTGMIQKSQLWNVLVINSTHTINNCEIELTLRDRNTGLEIFNATTNSFFLNEGSKQFNAALLQPIQYSCIVPTPNRNGEEFLSVGSYTGCYRLITSSDPVTQLAQECSDFDIEPLSLPMLIMPTDSSNLALPPSQFSWTPPTPSIMFNQLHYEVLITEIFPGQRPEEAIQQNIPTYTDLYARTNFLNYPATANRFQKDKWYAWQVIARDDKTYGGKSDVWVFQVNEQNNIENIIKGTPFIKMKLQNAETAIAPNGILKMTYNNRYNDTIAIIKISDVSTSNNEDRMPSYTMMTKPGDNKFQFNLSSDIKLKENNTYKAEIVNSKREKWSILFIIKTFNN